MNSRPRTRKPSILFSLCGWSLALLGCSSWASSDPPAVAAAQAIAARGKAPAVPACASCHGAGGEGSGGFPRLAGTGQVYLQAQLDAFASDARKNPLMQGFAKQLTAAERAALATYYSRLPPPAQTASPSAPTPGDVGSWLAARGRWSDDVPACVQCHGPAGMGIGPEFPPLAGLPAAYIGAQLQAWKEGTRPPGPLALMPAIARKLSAAEIAAVSDHFARQGAPQAPVAAASAPPP